MAHIDTIQVYRGAGAPTGLVAGELAWDTTNLVLYCGVDEDIVGSIIPGTAGIDLIHGTDEDVDIITLPNITGAPKLWWDESEDQFVFNLGLIVGAALEIDGDLDHDGSNVGFFNTAPAAQQVAADAAAFNSADGEIAGLTFSEPPTQAECNALRDKCEELGDDCRALQVSTNALIDALQLYGLVSAV